MIHTTSSLHHAQVSGTQVPGVSRQFQTPLLPSPAPDWWHPKEGCISLQHLFCFKSWRKERASLPQEPKKKFLILILIGQICTSCWTREMGIACWLREHAQCSNHTIENQEVALQGCSGVGFPRRMGNGCRGNQSNSCSLCNYLVITADLFSVTWSLSIQSLVASRPVVFRTCAAGASTEL